MSGPDSLAAVVGAPRPRIAPLRWLRENLFSSVGNGLLTVLVVALLAWLLPKALGWLFFNAVWGHQPLAA